MFPFCDGHRLLLTFRVNSGCYFVAHKVLILEFLSLTVFLKQQFLPLLVLLFLF